MWGLPKRSFFRQASKLGIKGSHFIPFAPLAMPRELRNGESGCRKDYFWRFPTAAWQV